MTPPRHYQIEGHKELLGSLRRALWWRPGTGKTRTAIMALDAITSALKEGERRLPRVLVICPSTVRLVWEQQLNLWSSHRLSTYIPKRNTEFPTVGNGVLILSYDRISVSEDTVSWLCKGEWDVLILDEAHALKDTASNRTKRIYRKIVKKAKRVWPLSGSPALNHAGELYPHFAALWPELITPVGSVKHMTRSEFEDRYCTIRMQRIGAREVRSITGTNPARVDELRQMLDRTGSRLRLEDVEKDMPPLSFDTVPLDVPIPSFQLHEPDDDDDLIAQLRSVSDHNSSARQLAGRAKAPVAVKYLVEQLDESDEKILVFAWHTSVLDELRRGLAKYKPVMIDGQTTLAERSKAIETFKTDPHCRVFIGQIKACGTGITLIEASRVFFVESSYTPEDNFQAACRAWRLGQKKPVVASHFTSPGRIDIRVHSILVKKENELAALLT